jgi:CheY-like chemotaxis protein
MHQKDQSIMELSASKQGHHPYRRGERRRKLFTPEHTVPPMEAGALSQHILPSMPVRWVVCITEQEERLRWLLGNALVKGGYCVAEAATPAQARARLEQKTFDLLLPDSDLPDDTSGRLLRALASSPPLAPPLIILPERQQAVEERDTALSGTVRPEPLWLADLLLLVERIRSAPGPPDGFVSADPHAKAYWKPSPRGSLLPVVCGQQPVWSRSSTDRLLKRSTPVMYDLLVVIVALVTFVALGAFVIFCERI